MELQPNHKNAEVLDIGTRYCNRRNKITDDRVGLAPYGDEESKEDTK